MSCKLLVTTSGSQCCVQLKRERETERQRQRETETETERETERERQRETERERETEKSPGLKPSSPEEGIAARNLLDPKKGRVISVIPETQKPLVYGCLVILGKENSKAAVGEEVRSHELQTFDHRASTRVGCDSGAG